MANVAIIGAGSLEFSSRLIADILSFPALAGTHFALIDIDPERLAFAGRPLTVAFAGACLVPPASLHACQHGPH